MLRKVKHTFIFETDAETLALKLQSKGIQYNYERGYGEFVVSHDLDVDESHRRTGTVYLTGGGDIPVATVVKNKFAINNALSVSVQRELGMLYGS